MIRCCGGVLFAAVQVLVVCFPDLRYFFRNFARRSFTICCRRLAEDWSPDGTRGAWAHYARPIPKKCSRSRFEKSRYRSWDIEKGE
jgi:hypothetical protein